ncbi:sensor histidine kinase [Streptomyces aureus]|uniref:sensor histidine kinase n=1 Tax=Streptomyces aureus TaxID=193461 RepID=UPI0033FE4B6A
MSELTGSRSGSSADRIGAGSISVNHFRSYEDAAVAAYAARLRAISSPLVGEPRAWQQCELQARRIFADCAESIALGRTTVTDSQIAEVVDLGAIRVRQSIHLTHSVRAGVILFDTVLEYLLKSIEDAGEDDSERVDGYTVAVRALQQGIGRRLEVGSIAYDSFMLGRVREVHEQGHRKLAREIHDQVGNSLSLAMRQLELYEVELGRQGGDVPPTVRAAQAAILETLARTRELVTELRRPSVSGCLEEAINQFVASMGDSVAPVRVWVRGLDEWIPQPVSEELFIMVRECLRNAFRHAEAGNIVVHIDIAPHEIQTEIIDDGLGFDTARTRAGDRANGLTGLQERADLVDGTLHIDSARGRGTHVTIWIPIKEGNGVR